jgi:hypothetical protein
MSHQAPTVTQSLSGKLRILDHKYLRTVEPWLPVAVWGLNNKSSNSNCELQDFSAPLLYLFLIQLLN